MDYPHNMGEDQCQQVINIQGRDKKTPYPMTVLSTPTRENLIICPNEWKIL